MLARGGEREEGSVRLAMTSHGYVERFGSLHFRFPSCLCVVCGLDKSEEEPVYKEREGKQKQRPALERERVRNQLRQEDEKGERKKEGARTKDQQRTLYVKPTVTRRPGRGGC